jgi:hypothetical protein
MNDMGTARGGQWHAKSVSNILENAAATGEAGGGALVSTGPILNTGPYFRRARRLISNFKPFSRRLRRGYSSGVYFPATCEQFHHLSI